MEYDTCPQCGHKAFTNNPKAMIAEGLISFDKERGYIILHRCGCLDKIPDNLDGDIIFSYSSPLEGYCSGKNSSDG